MRNRTIAALALLTGMYADQVGAVPDVTTVDDLTGFHSDATNGAMVTT